jgi:hypothetical protein
VIEAFFRYYPISLPFGYWLVARFYPDEPITWGELLVLALLIAVWPLTWFAMTVALLDP